MVIGGWYSLPMLFSGYNIYKHARPLPLWRYDMKNSWSPVMLCILVIILGLLNPLMAHQLSSSQETGPYFPGENRGSDSLEPMVNREKSMSLVKRLTFYPLQDSYIDEEKPYTNTHTYPLYFFIRVRSLEGANQRSLLQFDTRSDIPYGAHIIDAQLQVWLNFAPVESRVFDLYRVTEDWQDTSVTWINQPGYHKEATGWVETGDERKWLKWNVTNDTQGFFNGSFSNHGWLFKDRTEDAISYPGFFCTLRALESDQREYYPRFVLYFEEDHSSPFITFESPQDGTLLYTPTVYLRGWVEDNVGITHIGYHHEWPGGSQNDSWSLDHAFPHYTFEWPLLLHEGTNTLRVEALDMVGNTASKSIQLDYREDRLAPQVKIIRPQTGSLYINDRELLTGVLRATVILGKITSRVHAWDNESGIHHVDFLIDNETRYSDSESPFEWILDDTFRGWYRLGVAAFDYGGNQGADEQMILIFNL